MALWMMAVFLVAHTDYLISDRNNHRVQLCNASGLCNTVAGTGVAGSADNQLNWPIGMAITTAGDYLICDRHNHRVQLCPAHGAGLSCTTVAGTSGQGSGSTQLYLPTAVHLDANGDLLIVDSRNHRVQLCPSTSPGASCETVAGTGIACSGAADLNYPFDVAVDGAGDYIIADNSNHRIQLCPGSQMR